MVKEKNLVTKIIALLHFKQKSGVLNRYNSLISPLEFNTRKSAKHTKSVQEFISILSPNKFKGDLKRFGGGVMVVMFCQKTLLLLKHI